VQDDAFCTDVKDPAAQLAQARSLAAVPATLTNCPRAQVLHGLHEAALLTVLKDPAAQALHARSAVAEPCLLTSCPGPHAVHGVQGLAGFASWSHVPMPHACGAELAPAQYCPTAHGSHTAGIPAVPAVICFVPAAQEPCGTHCPAFVVDE
jgi:hypothetical protein